MTKSGANENAMDEMIHTGEDGVQPIETRLRHITVRVPEEIQQASGIVVYGRRIKSLLFTTDISLIRNNSILRSIYICCSG